MTNTKQNEALYDSPHNEGNQAAKPLDVDSIANEMMGAVPEVSEHAIEAFERKTENLAEGAEEDAPKQSAPGVSDLVDSQGIPFDVNIHRTNADGSPILTKTGKCRRKTGMGGATGSTLKRLDAQKEQAQNEQVKKQRIKATAGTAANMFFGVGMGVFGEEWRPNQNEAVYVAQSFEDYFTAIDFDDLPPGVALAVALGSFTLTRFSAPKSQTKEKTIGWVARMRTRLKDKMRQRKKGGPDRSDAEREKRNTEEAAKNGA